MKILIVDDHAVVREGARRLLATLPGAEITEAASARDALNEYRRSPPDLVILDINLEASSGLEFLQRLRALSRSVRVIMFSMHSNASYVSRALSAGAMGYVGKSAPASELIEAVSQVMAGRVYVDRELKSSFDAATAEYQFEEYATWVPSLGVGYHVGLDGISLLLVLLTTFLSPIALASAWHAIEDRTKEFVITLLVLETAMVGVFVSLDLFLFYVFWEAMLIPMYLVIGVWGGSQRVYAAVKFVLYTMVGSVLMLVAILALYYGHGAAIGIYTFDLPTIARWIIPAGPAQTLMFLAFALAFVFVSVAPASAIGGCFGVVSSGVASAQCRGGSVDSGTHAILPGVSDSPSAESDPRRSRSPESKPATTPIGAGPPSRSNSLPSSTWHSSRVARLSE